MTTTPIKYSYDRPQQTPDENGRVDSSPWTSYIFKNNKVLATVYGDSQAECSERAQRLFILIRREKI